MWSAFLVLFPFTSRAWKSSSTIKSLSLIHFFASLKHYATVWVWDAVWFNSSVIMIYTVDNYRVRKTLYTGIVCSFSCWYPHVLQRAYKPRQLTSEQTAVMLQGLCILKEINNSTTKGVQFGSAVPNFTSPCSCGKLQSSLKFLQAESSAALTTCSQK